MVSYVDMQLRCNYFKILSFQIRRVWRLSGRAYVMNGGHVRICHWLVYYSSVTKQTDGRHSTVGSQTTGNDKLTNTYTDKGCQITPKHSEILIKSSFSAITDANKFQEKLRTLLTKRTNTQIHQQTNSICKFYNTLYLRLNSYVSGYKLLHVQMSLWMTILLQMYFWRSCCHKDTNTNVDVLCRHRLLATMPYLYKYAAWIDDIFTCVCTSVVLPCDSASTVCDLSLSVLSALVLYCVSVLYCTLPYGDCLCVLLHALN